MHWSLLYKQQHHDDLMKNNEYINVITSPKQTNIANMYFSTPEDSPSESTSHLNYKIALTRPLSELLLAPQADHSILYI